jgi:hypothetical protein
MPFIGIFLYFFAKPWLEDTTLFIIHETMKTVRRIVRL